MKVASYQFPVSGDVEKNCASILRAVSQASKKGARLLVCPECAITGYPPRDVDSSKAVDYKAVEKAHAAIAESAWCHDIYVLVGTIVKEECAVEEAFLIGDSPVCEDKYFNTALVFTPSGSVERYSKRALWGWDKENFSAGEEPGVFEIDGFRIGIRICFEVRFPEYFRELYHEKTDLNVILFYDVSDREDPDRYNLIRGHVRTRAVENVAYTLTCNATFPHQTAPTALYDRSGRTLMELRPGMESALVFEINKSDPDFGEKGRIEISEHLIKESKKEPHGV
ncbi:MAG: carbon-nitrogen hydrolase family protein [Clostridiales bacterium]|nr:carbon-nitrogen hydrolase family protein [Clostridiales bacterium]